MSRRPAIILQGLLLQVLWHSSRSQTTPGRLARLEALSHGRFPQPPTTRDSQQLQAEVPSQALGTKSRCKPYFQSHNQGERSSSNEDCVLDSSVFGIG